MSYSDTTSAAKYLQKIFPVTKRKKTQNALRSYSRAYFKGNRAGVQRAKKRLRALNVPVSVQNWVLWKGNYHKGHLNPKRRSMQAAPTAKYMPHGLPGKHKRLGAWVCTKCGIGDTFGGSLMLRSHRKHHCKKTRTRKRR